MSGEILREVAAMQARARLEARAGRRIVFVPTMGYLHAGHVRLLEEGRRLGDVLVLSIFVNPLQFGPSEDLARYPRDEAGDLAKAWAVGTDLAFIPTVEEMYPAGHQTTVTVDKLSRGLCGDRRPGHFTGVATVVAKLFAIVRPDVAVFGEKDYQQLAVIRRMVRDLDLGIEIVGVPTVREPDGLAMSSRNAYLTADERRQAVGLSLSLGAAEARAAAGEREAARLLAAAGAELARTTPAGRVDYLELRDADTLEPVARLDRPAVMAMAVFLGRARLIDNRVLRP